MFDFHNGTNPVFVFVGIIVAQLFMYGRKVKDRVKIASSDVIADLMQFATMFIVCMGFLALAKGITGWDLKDPWQLVTVVIMFNMSFDAWFNRLRETFNTKVGAAVDVFLGRKIAVDQAPVEEAPPAVDKPRRAPHMRSGDPIKSAYSDAPDDNPELDSLVHKLDDTP